MNRRFLTLVATIAGFVMVGSLVLLPIMTYSVGEDSVSVRAVEHQTSTGAFLLLASWVAVAFVALSMFGHSRLLGKSDEWHCAISFLGFKLTGFFLIALLIAGTADNVSWGVGFWFALLACVVGTLAIYLTFNPALAKKIAAAAKSDDNEEGASGDEA